MTIIIISIMYNNLKTILTMIKAFNNYIHFISTLIYHLKSFGYPLKYLYIYKITYIYFI